MNTFFIIFAIAIMVVALLMLVSNLIKKTSRPSRVRGVKSSGARAQKSNTQWRSVRIKPGLICCDPVSKLTDRIFLASESPRLPLDGCEESDCRCKYVHLEDRRSGDDRRIELGDLSEYLPMNQTERRRIAGRRATDLAA